MRWKFEIVIEQYLFTPKQLKLFNELKKKYGIK